MIQKYFGTYRGLMRLLLSYVQIIIFRHLIKKAEMHSVKRLVFVCHGNICRSAFAQYVAQKHNIDSVSFGLSTTSNKPAYEQTYSVAMLLGYDMMYHRTTSVNDYTPREGDFLLAMEVRHLQRIKNIEKLSHLPRAVLGLWCLPMIPHLHDPYQLSADYMNICLRRIENAVTRICDGVKQGKNNEI
jgi:protein-tyrosine phosphatase